MIEYNPVPSGLYFMIALGIGLGAMIVAVAFYTLLIQLFRRHLGVQAIKARYKAKLRETTSTRPAPAIEALPQSPAIDGPIRYAHRWYTSIAAAAAYIGVEPRLVEEAVRAEGASAQQAALWTDQDPFPIAIRHRCLSVGRTKSKLFVADHPDNHSTGYVRKIGSYVRLEQRVPTGPVGDHTLLELAAA